MLDFSWKSWGIFEKAWFIFFRGALFGSKTFRLLWQNWIEPLEVRFLEVRFFCGSLLAWHDRILHALPIKFQEIGIGIVLAIFLPLDSGQRWHKFLFSLQILGVMSIVVLNGTFIPLEYPVGLMSLNNWRFPWIKTIFAVDTGSWFLGFFSLAVQHVDHSTEGFVFHVLFYAFWGLAILNSVFADDLNYGFLYKADILWLEGFWLVESDHISFPVGNIWVWRVFVDVLAIFLSGDGGLGFHLKKLLRG